MFFSLPVLMYHSISSFRHRLCVSPERFEEHCRVLSRNGWRGISLAEAEDFFLRKKRLPRKVCLFSFDDGYLDNYVYAEPLLRRYGHCGAIFPVVGFVEQRDTPRPNLENIERDGGSLKDLPPLDKRHTVVRSGRRVSGISFCSWAELKRMHAAGSLSAAPHSLRHARVVRRPVVKGLYMPRAHSGFFGVPPYEVLYGFPRFDLGHALADRAYAVAPEVFELIRNMVPQNEPEARAFLASPANREKVLEAIARLPRLGEFESEHDYRARIAEEFACCRDTFAKEMGFSPVSFCWPWGDYNGTALEEARKAGFKVFFSTGRKANRFGKAAAVYRIGVRRETGEELLSKLRFASHAVLEDIYGWIDHTVDPKLRSRSPC